MAATQHGVTLVESLSEDNSMDQYVLIKAYGVLTQQESFHRYRLGATCPRAEYDIPPPVEPRAVPQPVRADSPFVVRGTSAKAGLEGIVLEDSTYSYPGAVRNPSGPFQNPIWPTPAM